MEVGFGADLKLGLNTEGTEKRGEHGEALAYKWAAKRRFHCRGAEYAEKSRERPGDSDSEACAMDVVVLTDCRTRRVAVLKKGAPLTDAARGVCGEHAWASPGGKRRWRATALHREARAFA